MLSKYNDLTVIQFWHFFKIKLRFVLLPSDAEPTVIRTKQPLSPFFLYIVCHIATSQIKDIQQIWVFYYHKPYDREVEIPYF